MEISGFDDPTIQEVRMTSLHSNLPGADDDPLSTSAESYLDVIHELSHQDETVRSVDVADKLGVTKVSVNKALHVLKQAGLVTQEPYRGIRLTQEGVEAAHRVTWRHEVWRAFFVRALGMDEGAADAEACRLEHVAGEDVVRRLEAYLAEMGEA
jgi:Mn-dependent DtxR family transcriptional regulator